MVLSDNRKKNLSRQAIDLSGYFQALRESLHSIDKKNPETSSVLSAQEAQLLLCLGTRGALTMGEIAQSLQLTLSSITTLIDKLEAKAFVSRERSLEDRRSVRVVLTVEGRKFHGLVEGAHRRLSVSVLKALSQKDRDTLLLLFKKVAAKLRSDEPKR